MSDETTGFESGAVQPATGSQTESTSTAIDLSDDSLVRINGAKDPVKYGDYYRGIQSQLTKKSQEAARLAAERGQFQQTLTQREELIRRYEAHLRSQQSNGGTKASPIDGMKSLPYISGEDAAKLAEYLSGQFGGYGQELSKRDQVLTVLAQELLNMKQQFGQVQTERTNVAFDGKINGWLKSLGLPPEAADLAKEVYLAYEGPDLDEEFPAILKQRWESLQKLFKSMEAKKIQDLRSKPFVPGAGGTTTPSKPLEMKANASSKEIADMLWPMLNGGGDT